MWVALFDFCLFLLLVAFFFHGLSAWDRLLSDGGDEDDEAGRPARRGKSIAAPGTDDHPAGRYWAIWVLVVGGGLTAFAGDLLAWFLG